MNQHHMMALDNETMATRRAEADRARLARSGHRRADAARSATRTRPARHGFSLGSLLHRVALL